MSNRLTQMNYFVTQVIKRGLTQDNQAASRWFRTNRAWRIPTGQAVGQFEMHQRHQDPHHVQDQAAGQGAHCAPEGLLQARAALRLMRAAFDCAQYRNLDREPEAAEALQAADAALVMPIHH